MCYQRRIFIICAVLISADTEEFLFSSLPAFIIVISTELDELMMEAQLLQVSLPEIQELYQILFTKQSPVLQTEQRSSVGLTNEKASV